MAVEIHCQRCSQAYSFRDSAIGQTFRCRQCGTRQRVTLSDERSPRSQPADSDEDQRDQPQRVLSRHRVGKDVTRPKLQWSFEPRVFFNNSITFSGLTALVGFVVWSILPPRLAVTPDISIGSNIVVCVTLVVAGLLWGVVIDLRSDRPKQETQRGDQWGWGLAEFLLHEYGFRGYRLNWRERWRRSVEGIKFFLLLAIAVGASQRIFLALRIGCIAVLALVWFHFTRKLDLETRNPQLMAVVGLTFLLPSIGDVIEDLAGRRG